MRFDDLRKLATGNVLFNLGRIISPRLVTIVYLLGLASIALWAINHVFATFRFGFGNGLWGLLEIAVFGLLAITVLRIACEAVIVYFRTHAADADDITPARPSASLIDEVREAIEELADQEIDSFEPEPEPVMPAPSSPLTPAPSPTPAQATDDPALVPDPDAPHADPAPKTKSE